MPSNSPTLDVRDLLVNAGVGAAGSNGGGWSIFIGLEPDEPIDTITLYDTPGDPPHPRWLLDYPRFQVRTRSLSYNDAYQKAEEAKSALLGLPSQDFNGTRYVGIYTVLDTFFLMTDLKGRSIFVNTWRCIREPSSGRPPSPPVITLHVGKPCATDTGKVGRGTFSGFTL